MNVNNRKMFKPRPARNQLNQMGGIMASSPQLIDTVARFQQGGSIYANQPSMITSIMDFLNTGNAQSGVGQIQDQNAMIRAGVTPQDMRRVQAATIANQTANQGQRVADVNRVQAATEANQIADSVQAAQSMPVSSINIPGQVQNIENQLSDLGGLMTPAQVAGSQARMSQLQEAQSGQLAEDIFGTGYAPPSEFMMPGVTPSPSMPRPAAGKPSVPPQTAAQLEADAADNAAVIDAAKRGELGAAEQVKAVVQQGTPAEQQEQLTKLMNEFKQNAPEFKGTDRGLAIAKIGFAMAAGQSPNAITNIANALNEGADALIKDKRERDAFNRQVELSALQYGLGEVSKERAQQRLDERTFTDFVDQETGEPVRISNADYFANGNKLPEGLMNKELYTKIQAGINDRAKAARDLIIDAENRKFLKPSDVRTYREDYSALVDQASESETAAAFLEKVISSAAEDEITGPYAAAKSAAAKVGAVFGVDLPESFTTRDRAIQDLKAALQPMVKVTLGNTQSANSISDRDVNLLIQGFLADGIMNENADGVLNFVAVPQEVFVNSLQNGLRQIRKSQASTLNNMSAIESELADLYTPAGKPGTAVIQAYQQQRPNTRPAQGARTLQLDPETGQYFVPGT